MHHSPVRETVQGSERNGRERVAALKTAMLRHQRAVYVERARLYTRSYRETEGQPEILRRARAFAYTLREMTIRIDDHELIVGNRSPRSKDGVVSPEMGIGWLEEELDSLPTRPQDRFQITEEEKRELREEIFPYWRGRTLQDRIMARLPEDVLQRWKAKVIKLNQTDKGQGHIIPDLPRLLQVGLEGLLAESRERLAALDMTRAENHERALFHRAASLALQGAIDFARRYARLAREMANRTGDAVRRRELLAIAEICDRVPARPPRTFHEALQAAWLGIVIAQVESNASSIAPGRFDQYMFPYYDADMKAGRLTREQALELLECLWIKFNDIVAIRSSDSARAFAGFPIGFNIVLGGQTPAGDDATNELSYLCLDAQADLRLPQPNLGIRVHSRSPHAFLARAAQVIALGSGMPQVFNDEVCIPALLNRGVSLADARDYGVVGCVEISVPGKTYGLHDIAMFNMMKALELAINGGVCLLTQKQVGLPTPTLAEMQSYDDLEAAFRQQVDYFIEPMIVGSNMIDQAHAEWAPTPFLSTIIDGCLESGRDVSAGGARYNFSGVQGIGVPNAADALAALKKLVFTEGLLSRQQVLDALRKDYQNAEDVRLILLNKAPKYGNDDDEVDRIGAWWLRYYCEAVARYRNWRGGLFQPGSYTVSAHVPLGADCGASADGRHARQQLADGGLSPAHGRDKFGPTAVLRSVGKLDHTLLSNGGLLNLKFHPSALSDGLEGIQRLAGFLRAFTALKAIHVQFNVVSAETLRAAQRSPEEYRGLVVRVAGYSAFFTELNPDLQEDIIMRTEHAI